MSGRDNRVRCTRSHRKIPCWTKHVCWMPKSQVLRWLGVCERDQRSLHLLRPRNPHLDRFVSRSWCNSLLIIHGVVSSLRIISRERRAPLFVCMYKPFIVLALSHKSLLPLLIDPADDTSWLDRPCL